MYAYQTSTGLHSVELIAHNLWLRNWWVPDLICDEIISVLPSDKLNFYHVNDDLTIDWSTVKIDGPSVLYSIDYFGEEQNLIGRHDQNVIIVRDNVFADKPYSDVRPGQIWFNSLRKLVRGVTGSLILSSVSLGGVEASSTQQLCLTYDELSIRQDNHHTVSVLMPEFSIEHHPIIPTLYPLRLKNRDEVLSKLDFKLPGMWKNKYNLPNKLYQELTFLPLDSRFTRQELVTRCDRIRELAECLSH